MLWPRVTSDVDVVVDATTRSRYYVLGEAEEVGDGDASDRLVAGAEDERLPAALD